MKTGRIAALLCSWLMAFPVAASAQAPPIITSISPSVARAGDTLFIRGRNFTAGTMKVRFGSVTDKTYELGKAAFDKQGIPLRTDTIQLVVVPPTVFAKPYYSVIPVSVETPGGYGFAPRDLYERPLILSVTPRTVNPGDRVVVRGRGMSGDVYLQVHAVDRGAQARGIDVADVREIRITSYSARAGDSLVFAVPGGFQNSPIRLRTEFSDGVRLLAESDDTLSVRANLPVITALQPRTIRPGDTLRIFGRRFGAGSARVYFAATFGKVFADAHDVTAADGSPLSPDTVLEVIVPPYAFNGKPTSITVSLQNAAGIGAAPYSLTQRGVITSVVPTRVSPGDKVTVRGTYLDGDVYLQVRALNDSVKSAGLDGEDKRETKVSRYIAQAGDSIVFLAPGGFQSSPVRLRREYPDGAAVTITSGDTLALKSGLPSITSIAPAFAGPGDTITLVGRNFGARVVSIRFGQDTRGPTGIALEAVADDGSPLNADTIVRVVVPADAFTRRYMTSVPVWVQSSAGAGTAALELYQRPQIQSVAPRVVGAGDRVVVRGKALVGDVYLQVYAANDSLRAIGEAADDNREIKVASYLMRSADSLSFAVPGGFERSPIRLRMSVAAEKLLFAQSTDTLVVGQRAGVAPPPPPPPPPAPPAPVTTMLLGATGVPAKLPIPECSEGCFVATADGYRLNGTAIAAQTPDGFPTLNFMVGGEGQADVVSFSAHSALRMRAGATFVVNNNCNGAEETTGITASYSHADERSGNIIIHMYTAKAGSLTIGAIRNGFVTGRFDFTSCEKLDDRMGAGPHVAGAFKAINFGF